MLAHGHQRQLPQRSSIWKSVGRDCPSRKRPRSRCNFVALHMKKRIKSKEILIQLVWYLRWKRKRQIVVLQKVGENLGKFLGKNVKSRQIKSS